MKKRLTADVEESQPKEIKKKCEQWSDTYELITLFQIPPFAIT